MKNMVTFVICAALIYTAYNEGESSGYNEGKKEILEKVIKAEKEAQKKQAESQTKAVTASNKYQEALRHEQARTVELNDTIKTLRNKRTVCPDNDSFPDYSHYILFNESADTDKLQESGHIQFPDEEADGLDAIQYSIAEYNRVAAQTNSLIEIIEGLDCVSIAQ